MNERIRELEAQCWEPRQYGPAWFNSTKFAELIVRECMEQVWYSREDGINGNVSEVIKDRIKQHFGVNN